MNWKNVRLIFHREVRDQIRDRRTLFMVVVLPLLLYPGLAIGMVEVSLLFREQPRTVVVLGAANLPPKPPLLKGARVRRRMVRNPRATPASCKSSPTRARRRRRTRRRPSATPTCWPTPVSCVPLPESSTVWNRRPARPEMPAKPTACPSRSVPPKTSSPSGSAPPRSRS